jgi:hypothetical protein
MPSSRENIRDGSIHNPLIGIPIPDCSRLINLKSIVSSSSNKEPCREVMFSVYSEHIMQRT